MLKKFLHEFKSLINQCLSEIYSETKLDKNYVGEFKNKYEGQSCFVIGNGPSLKPDDLTRIKELGYVTFAANKIYRIFDKTAWRPTFVSVSDTGILGNAEVAHNIDKINPEMLFVRSQIALKTKKFNSNVCILRTDANRKLLDNPQFSLDINNIIYDIATVTYFNLQIAAYMGFTTIYLIGCDEQYKFGMTRDGKVYRNEGVTDYFGEDAKEEPLPKVAPAIWESDAAYEYAEKFSMEHGFRIFNATRGGCLEKFERVNLDNVLGTKDGL